jgi:glutamine amidotransferase
MCRWLAYSGRPIFLDTLVSKPCHSLIHQSQSATECLAATNGDGFGLGWYGAWEEPGLFRDAMPAWNDDNLKSLTHQISSPLFFAHVRASTGTPTTRVNCHPFASGRWMFMHNGQVGGWDRIRRRLEVRLSDARYHERRGSTDSEVLFLLLNADDLDADPIAAMPAWTSPCASPPRYRMAKTCMPSAIPPTTSRPASTGVMATTASPWSPSRSTRRTTNGPPSRPIRC